jgi:YfiH family protein
MNFELLLEEVASVTAVTSPAGFNVCHYAGATPEQYLPDRRRLAAFMAVEPTSLFIPRQTHSARVAHAGVDLDLEGVDALVSNRPGQVLCINTADCLPLLLADEQAGVIGAAHCGWRGTVAGIALRTLEAMMALGARPERIHAAMGPCLCLDCFEVGEEVAAQFPPEMVCRRPGEKPHVDLAATVAAQLRSRGVTHIALPTACSKCSPAGHNSVRRQGRDWPLRTLTAIRLR